MADSIIEAIEVYAGIERLSQKQPELDPAWLIETAFNTMRHVAAKKQRRKSMQGEPQKIAEAFEKEALGAESQWMDDYTDLPEQYEGVRYLLQLALEEGIDVAKKTLEEIEEELRTLGQFRSRTRKRAS